MKTEISSSALNKVKASSTRFQSLKQNPARFIAKLLYERTHSASTPGLAPFQSPVTLVCVSDTHNKTPTVPDGDIFLHAGDLTVKGTFDELQAQLHWINNLPHQHKLVIGGNHDFLLDREFMKNFPDRKVVEEGHSRDDLDWGNIRYLENSSTTVDVRGRHISIFGCPLTAKSGNWAFQYSPSQNIWEDLVPVDCDILLTHGPPKGHLDVYETSRGCQWLLRELWNKKPRLVIFGHIHAGHGIEHVDWGHVQSVHDRAMVGDVSLLSIILMFIAWLANLIRFTLSHSPRHGVSTFINAAVVAGKNNVDSQPSTVIDI